MAKAFDAVTADNLKRLREAAGLSQEGLAHRASELGLEWTRDHVAAIERYTRRLSFSEAVALTHTLGATLQDLLETEGPVAVAPTMTVDGANLADACSLGLGSAHVRTAFDTWLDQRFPPPAPGSKTAKDRAARELAAQKAGHALGKSPMVIAMAALRLWRRSLTAERDARVEALLKKRAQRRRGVESPSPRTLQALRGRVSRELYGELEASFVKAASKIKG